MAATRKLDQSRIMLSAAESGNRAAQTALDSRMNRRQRDLDRGERARQFDEGVEQQELNRWQRQWENRRGDRERRAADLAERQAAKPRTTNFGTEGVAPGGEAPAADPRVELQQQQLAERQRQFDVQTQMTAADKGLQQTGGGPVAGGAPGPDNPRLTALQQEMQQRGDRQMGQGIEQQAGGRGFVKTAERQKKEQATGDVAMERAKTDRINAIIRHRELVQRYETAEVKLQAAKTGASRKEAKAALEKIDKDLMQPIDSTDKMLSRLRKADVNPDLWQAVEKLVSGEPEESNRPETLEEIRKKQFGPNVARFLSEKQASEAIKYTEGTGNMPPGKKVEYSTEGMQLLVRNTKYAKHDLTTGVNAEMWQAMDQAEFNGMVNKRAADLTRRGIDLEKLIQQANQRGGMPQGAQGQPGGPTDQDIQNVGRAGGGPPMREERALPGGRVPPGGQVTPAGAAAKGGMDFTNQPYPTKGPPPPRTPQDKPPYEMR